MTIDVDKLALQLLTDPETKTASWRGFTILAHPAHQLVILDEAGKAEFLMPGGRPLTVFMPRQEVTRPNDNRPTNIGLGPLPVMLNNLVPDDEAWLVDPATQKRLVTVKITPAENR